MKRLLLVICGIVITCACGGSSGGSGGGGGNYTPPAISVSISPATQSNIDQGQSLKFTATVENDSASKGVTWSASGTGVTGAACGTFANITTASATYNAPSPVSANLTITITGTSVADPTKTASVAVVVSPPPSVTTTTLTNATPNANYSAALQATGGVGMLTWNLTSGSLPAGLSLSSAGAITGVPTASGASAFTVQVTDSSAAAGGSAAVQAQLSLTVVTVVDISTKSLPAGSEGISYLAGIEASGGTPPYIWSLASGSLPPGLAIQPSSGVISGTPPSQGSFTFTVAAQDSSPTKQSQTRHLTIAIGAPGPLAITTSSLLDGTVGTAYNAKVVAVGGTPPYRWSIPVGALPAGASLSLSTGAITGTPSSTGTANFTVVVTDSSPVPETQAQEISLTIDNAGTVCSSSGNNAVLSGPYAFILSGFNDVGFLTVVGSFTADGTGKITAGEADTNGVLGAQQGNIITSLSSYSVGPDNRGCANLATPFGTFFTRFTLGAISSSTATGGRIIEWDSPSTSAYIATGQLLRQTASVFAAGLTGSYVFSTVGWDTSPLGGRDVCVGVLSAAGNTFNTLEMDCNDAWTLSNTTASSAAGAYSTLDANGRGTGIIGLGEGNSNITFYAVSSSQLLMVNADPGPTVSGDFEQQTVPPGRSGFTAASLNGNLVFSLNGLSLAGTASAASIETASADGNSSLAIKFYADRAGTMQVSSTLTCTYAVEPNGRVTLSGNTQSCGSNPPVFYLKGLNTGVIVDAAPGVDAGSFEPQSAGPFNNASVSGRFFAGLAEVVKQSAQAEVGPIAPDGRGNISGTTEISSTSAQNPGSPFPAATYAVNSNGTFSVSSSGGAVTGVIISSTKFLMFSPSTLGTDDPTLLVMEK
jgi:hypothetical protein